MKKEKRRKFVECKHTKNLLEEPKLMQKTKNFQNFKIGKKKSICCGTKHTFTKNKREFMVQISFYHTHAETNTNTLKMEKS